MKFVESFVLLPCHSLEDFPTYHEGALADGLLGAWSAQWHPAILAATGHLPGWRRADGPPAELAQRLIIIPEVSESLLAAGWASRASEEGAHVVRKIKDRGEIVAAALTGLEGGDGGVSSDLAADFLALGVNFLLVELLTRQMRYMSNVDEVHLRNEAVAAAESAVAHDDEAARRRLKNCFDSLAEARERFYPVDAYLIDLTLVAKTTLGPSLEKELACDAPFNLLLSAELLAAMADKHPATLVALRSAIDRNVAEVAGGEWHESELPLQPLEFLLENLRIGGETYREMLGAAPRVFARRRAGLSPSLPQALSRSGFTGAVHLTLEDGQFPESGQSKIRWQGLDSSAIDALARLPLDASLTQAILGLPRKLGAAMDHDHVATAVFAHWPGRASIYYEDLRRAARYAKVLGRFIRLGDYFDSTQKPGELTRFRADQYRVPYLKQSLAANGVDPISRTMRAHARDRRLYAAQTAAAWSEMLGGPSAGTQPLTTRNLRDAALDDAELDRDIDAASLAANAVLAGRLGFSAGSDAGSEAAVAINLFGESRLALADVSCLAGLPDVVAPVTAVQQIGERKLAVVEIPAFGFAAIRSGSGSPAPKARRQKPMAEGLVLRNEHFEAAINEETGGIRSLYDANGKLNRLSQQLTLRSPGARPKPGDFWRDPDESAVYARSICEAVDVVSPGPAYGEIVVRGRIIDDEARKLAGFVQRLQAHRGSHILRIEIELDVAQPLAADAWNAYYAARFALPDVDTEMFRGVQACSQPTSAKRLEAPEYVEFRAGKWKTSFLTAGLPYHRFIAPRMFETMLSTGSESCRRFSLGVGLDLAHPAVQARSFLDESVVVPCRLPTGGRPMSGWLFHLDVKNVIVTHWQAVVADGRTVGLRVRLLECEGRAGRANLRTFRPAVKARQTDFHGTTLVELTPTADAIPFDLGAHEWVQLEALWSP